MAEINDFNVTDATNVDRWPEGMALASVNDAGRADEGILGRWYTDRRAIPNVTGSGGDYVITLNRQITALFVGLDVDIVPNHNNPGVARINVNNLGLTPIRKQVNVELDANQLITGQAYRLRYDGTQFQVLSLLSNLGTADLGDGAVTFAKLVSTLQSQINSAAIVGEIRSFAGATTPGLWLPCDGAAVSRTTYSELFGVINTKFGTGDGSTTFNVPDSRGRSVIGTGAVDGTGTNRALADKGGAETHALTEAELAAHTHGVGTYSVANNASTIREIIGTPTTGNRGLNAASTNTDNAFNNRAIANDHSHNLSGASASTGSGTAHNNMHPFLAVNQIIFANA